MNKLDITLIFVWGFIYYLAYYYHPRWYGWLYVCSDFSHLCFLEMLDERFCEFQLYWGVFHFKKTVLEFSGLLFAVSELMLLNSW